MSATPTPNPSGAWSRSDYVHAYAELEQKLATAAADKRRRDWLEAQSTGMQWVARRSTTGRGYRVHNSYEGMPDAPLFPTAREAIDAALSAETKPES